MRQLLITSALALFILALDGGNAASAQTGQRLSATPKAFQVFYAKFRRAVVARDKMTVASMTRFPFNYGFDAGDEGTFSRTQFLRRFNDILGGRRPIFRRTNPNFYADGGRFELVDETDASHFIFEKQGASYRFVSYMSEP